MAEQEQTGELGGLEDKIDEARANAVREHHDAEGAFGGGKNGTRKGGITDTGLSPSDYPSGDSPIRLTKGKS